MYAQDKELQIHKKVPTIDRNLERTGEERDA